MDFSQYTNDAIDLLKRLIAVPSVSRDECAAADIMEEELRRCGFCPQREGNNVWALSPDFDGSRETILLNAHIDTVKPVASWTRNPFEATEEDGRIYGLGSNDCGGGLVSLLQVFRIICAERKSLVPLEGPGEANFVYLASCEEEVSGANGIERVLPLLPRIDVAIVGEPTGMNPAIAEKGLMVLDITARGKSGHAARNEGRNAIYEMLDDLMWLRSYKFTKTSPLLGDTLMQVTQLNSGTQHNVVPDECRAVVDVRTNEFYRNEDVFEIVRLHCKSEVKARSFRLHSSCIDPQHPLIQRCEELGMTPFGSPTLSDQALMPFASFKLGPGQSARSHSADEYICRSEIDDAIKMYIKLLQDESGAFA